MRGNGLNLQCGVLKTHKAMPEGEMGRRETPNLLFFLNKMDYVPKNIIIVLIIIITIYNI